MTAPVTPTPSVGEVGQPQDRRHEHEGDQGHKRQRHYEHEHDPEETGHAHGYLARRDEYLTRLRRIEGQIRGLQRMVAEEKYCIDILTQVSAATRALQSVALGLLEEHVSTCVAEAIQADGPAGPRGSAKIREASAAIERLVRS